MNVLALFSIKCLQFHGRLNHIREVIIIIIMIITIYIFFSLHLLQLDLNIFSFTLIIDRFQLQKQFLFLMEFAVILFWSVSFFFPSTCSLFVVGH
jgi:hypothetical protein